MPTSTAPAPVSIDKVVGAVLRERRRAIADARRYVRLLDQRLYATVRNASGPEVIDFPPEPVVADIPRKGQRKPRAAGAPRRAYRKDPIPCPHPAQPGERRCRGACMKCYAAASGTAWGTDHQKAA